MTQPANYTVENGSGAQVRADMNSIFDALASSNAGATAPPDARAFMIWADTTNNLLKMRNAANTAWLVLPIAIDAANTAPEDLAVLGDLVARSYLLMGASGAEWQIDPQPQGSGAQLLVGPREASQIVPAKGYTIDRATGKISIGTASTNGAADHLEVHGGMKVNGHGLTLPDGTRLHTAAAVQVLHRGDYNGAIFSTAWYTPTGFGLEITPTSATSKILVLANVVGGSNGLAWWRVHRDGSPLAATSNMNPEDERATGNLMTHDNRVPVTQSAVLLDEPGTISPVTYELAFRAQSGSNALYLNAAPSQYVGDGWDQKAATTLTVIELGG